VLSRNIALEIQSKALREANTELTLSIGLLQTELAQSQLAEKTLRDADRSKDEFLATVAHELLNPLAPLHNAVEIMMRTPLEGPLLIWSRDMIARQVAHMTRLVNDLVDVSRCRIGKVEVRKRALELATIVDASVEMSRPAIHARRHSLVVQIPDYPVVMEGDPIRLTQVVSNLLTNAAKYTPEGGTIWVSLEKRRVLGDVEENAVIRVRDSGICRDAVECSSRSYGLIGARRGQRARHRTPWLGSSWGYQERERSQRRGGQGSEFVVVLPCFPRSRRYAGTAELQRGARSIDMENRRTKDQSLHG
jgi:K+-sensing histidine kinase KdpD